MDSKIKLVVVSDNKADGNAPKIEPDSLNIFHEIDGKIIASG